ncbi:MAG: PAS domain S-box protein [Haloplanus sp.]
MEWLEEFDAYDVVQQQQPITEASFDLCIVDEGALKKNAATLKQRKEREKPELLPYLLLLPTTGTDFLTTEEGQIADTLLTSTIDEMISIPVQQAEFRWRIESLLRLRAQTQRLSENKQEVRQFKRAVDHAGAAIYITAPDGTIEYVNPAFEELTGYSHAEAVGKTPHILNSGEEDATYFERLWETIQRGEVWSETVVDRKKSGEKYTAMQTIAPIVDDTDDVSAYVAVQHDISDRLRNEQRIRVLNRVLRHNLRTNLNVILGHIRTVADASDDDETAEAAIQTIRERCDRLLNESKKAREAQELLNREDVHPRSVAEIKDRIERDVVEAKSATVRWVVDVDSDALVPGVVERAIVELVENAIEHTSRCSVVTITVGANSEGDIEFIVEDDGPGLPEMEKRVLETGTETALEHGKGIGLWLTYWLVRAVGGTIAFDEHGTSGTAISVRAPRAMSAKQE